MVFILMLMGAVSFYTFFRGAQDNKPLPDSFILVHDLAGSLPDFNEPPSFFDAFLPQKVSLYGVIRTLSLAAEDDRVSGFALRMRDGDYSLTQIETLRQAVSDFRQSGKKTYVYTDSFGGFSNGMGEYWLASAFDEIWVQPVGTVSLNGIRVEQPHAREALDKIGIKPEIVRRKDYKTAPEYMTRRSMSPESRETLQAIAEDILTRMVTGIRQNRPIDIAQLELAIDNSPLSAEQAREIGLIDKIGYADEIETVLQGVGRDRSTVSIGRYAAGGTSNNGNRPALPVSVAVITVNGMILETDPHVAEKTPFSAFIPSDIADAGDIAVSLMEAADDPAIKVILLRINSPGGAPTASETIRRAVVYARDKGKYVIASMGEMAASGGYWIAVDASQIIASDLTLTGSIGVYGGKVNLSGLWDKIGINWEAVEYGQNAAMWSPHTGYDAEELERLNAMMDYVYNAFVTRVAEGRRMDKSDVEEIAKGRAWTGIAARENGLVDLNGGLGFALKRAASEAGITDWRRMRFALLPEADDPLDDLMALIGMEAKSAAWPLAALKQEIGHSLIYPQAVVTAPILRISY